MFDLGGVVLESPLRFIAEYEGRYGIERNLVARLVGGYASTEGPWQMLERGQISLVEFCERFDADIRAAGVETVSTLQMMREMSVHTEVRREMLEAIRRLRTNGFKVGALTNNWVTEDEQDVRIELLRAEFHVFVESCKVGMRKPEPGIFELACRELGVRPEAVVFLDDIGSNLKVARRLGMTTIKVGDAGAALDALSAVVGLALR
jgi:putative hydrolase of the HAD superfamily